MILAGFSPAARRSLNASYAEPTTLPHVKQRTGMIMGAPVRLLALLAGTAAEGLLALLGADVVDEQGAVVREVLLLQLAILGVVDDAAGDGRADRVRLAVHAAAGDRHAVDQPVARVPHRSILGGIDLGPLIILIILSALWRSF